jgi:hypothetical protein
VLEVLALDVDLVVDELRPRTAAVVGLAGLVDAPQLPAARLDVGAVARSGQHGDHALAHADRGPRRRVSR